MSKMPSEYKDRFADAMRSSGVTEHRLARELDVTYQAIKKVILGTTKMLRADHNVVAAQVMRVDSEWLATGEGSKVTDRVWPLSTEALQALQQLDGPAQLQVENMVRVMLKMPTLPAEVEAASVQREKQPQRRVA